MKVAITGVLTTFVSDKKVESVQKTFTLEFVYRTGKIFLKSFKEVNQNDPFDDKNSITNNSIFIQR